MSDAAADQAERRMAALIRDGSYFAVRRMVNLDGVQSVRCGGYETHDMYVCVLECNNEW